MPRAAITLGRMYEHGDGVAVDKGRAKTLYQLVCCLLAHSRPGS